MKRQFLLLADNESKFSPTSVSRRSLSGLQYNSSIDARDDDTTREGVRLGAAGEQVHQSTLQNIVQRQQQPSPFTAYNVSNDEEGLLIFELSTQLDSESNTDDDNIDEVVASGVELEQHDFEEETEKGQAELTTTTTTSTSTSTTASTTATTTTTTTTINTTTTTSPPSYFYSCADNSYDDSDRNNVSNEAAPTSTSPTMSSYSSFSVDTNRESLQIAKQVIRFDYDLLVASKEGMASTSAKQQSQAEEISMENIYSMVHQFETRLLKIVGLELSMNNNLNISLFCDGADNGDNVLQLESIVDDLPVASGRERNGEGREMLLRGGEQQTLQSSLPGPVVTLTKLSSLPSDEILNATECAEDPSSSLDGITSSIANVVCFPIAGYMSVYYFSEHNGTAMLNLQDTNSYIRSTMKVIIQRGIANITDSVSLPMMMNANGTHGDNSNGPIFIVSSAYVGSHRDSRTSATPDEYKPWSQLQIQSEMESSSSSSSPWLSTPVLVGTIVAGSLVMIALGLLAFFAARRSRKRSVTSDDDDYDDGTHSGEVENGYGDMIIPPIHFGGSTCPTSRQGGGSINTSLNDFPDVIVGYNKSYHHHHHQQQHQQQQHQDWLGHAFTIETDTTPRVSNVHGKQQRNNDLSRSSPSGTFHGQSIQECDEEDDEST